MDCCNVNNLEQKQNSFSESTFSFDSIYHWHDPNVNCFVSLLSLYPCQLLMMISINDESEDNEENDKLHYWPDIGTAKA